MSGESLCIVREFTWQVATTTTNTARTARWFFNILIVQWSICVQETEYMHMYMYYKYTQAYLHTFRTLVKASTCTLWSSYGQIQCVELWDSSITIIQSCSNVSHHSGRSKNAPKQVILQTRTRAHITFWEEQKQGVHVMIQTLTKCEGSPQVLQQR